MSGDPLWSNAESDFPYRTWKVRIHYLWNSGRMQMPVAGGASASVKQACEIIRTSAPFGGKVVEWVAEREGAPPDIPDPGPYDENTDLKSFEVVCESPDMMADFTTQVYRAEGIYSYVFLTPITFTDAQFYMGASPADSTSN